jgi:uncharacterized cupredoxin-like copper-binding protein
MSVEIESRQEETTANLEAELEQLQHELANRKATRSATLLAVFIGVLIAIAALIAVSLRLQSNQNAATAMHDQMGGAGPGAPASSGSMPSGGSATMGGGTMGARGGAGTATQVTAQLGDYYVHSSRSSVPAGQVTFVAQNVGQLTHELMIERMPIKMDAPGQPDEAAAQGMVNDMAPGQSGQMTVSLKPGRYMLFCNVPGHYAQGQRAMFTVTR